RGITVPLGCDSFSAMTIHRLSLLASLSLAAPVAFRSARHEPPPAPNPAVVDSLRILYIGRPAGWEHYELKPTAAGMTLPSDYDHVDRGRRNHSQLTLTTAKDYALKTYETVRITDTSRTVTTSVEFDGTRAKFTRNGKPSDVAIPAVAYAVSSYAPTAQHLA